jgi:hypothetical protein
MSEQANWSDLANTKVGEVERPKPIPTGHYICAFSGPMKQHKAKSGNLAMRFVFKVQGPTEDVDQTALEAAGGIPDKEMTLDFWMSPDARWRFTDFAKAQGASDELSLLETAEWLVTEGNKPFLLEATHSPNEKDPEAPPFVRWDNPAPYEG